MSPRVLCATSLLFALFALVACDEQKAPAPARTTASPLEVLKAAPVSSVALQDVVDAFVLGSANTDLQRDLLGERLAGSVVTWKIRVHDVAKDDSGYRVTSELMSGSHAASIGKFGVVAFIFPTGAQDVQRLQEAQTGSELVIQGRSHGVHLRTLAVLSPAVLLPAPP